jgi:ABC-2 type transport system permease protein
VVTAKLVGGYVGFILVGAAFIAFGLFASSLTENQFIAAIIGVVGLLVIQLAETLASSLEGFAGKALEWFSLLSRYRTFVRGVFDIVPVVYFLSFIVLFLFLTVRVIEKRRWA